MFIFTNIYTCIFVHVIILVSCYKFLYKNWHFNKKERQNVLHYIVFFWYMDIDTNTHLFTKNTLKYIIIFTFNTEKDLSFNFLYFTFQEKQVMLNNYVF